MNVIEEGTLYIFDGEWALDICLDYFACRNPFLADIEAIDSSFADTLAKLVTGTRMRSAPDGDSLLEPAKYKTELARFRSLLSKVLRARDETSISELTRCYDSQDEARRLIDSLVESLSASQDSAILTEMAMETLPNLCMPHDRIIDSQQDLDELVRLRLESAARHIRLTRKDSGDPMIVTVARSALDGFTPCSIVDRLQKDILSVVHDVFCGCDAAIVEDSGQSLATSSQVESNCRLKVLFDYESLEENDC